MIDAAASPGRAGPAASDSGWPAVRAATAPYTIAGCGGPGSRWLL